MKIHTVARTYAVLFLLGCSLYAQANITKPDTAQHSGLVQSIQHKHVVQNLFEYSVISPRDTASGKKPSPKKLTTHVINEMTVDRDAPSQEGQN